MAGGWAGGNAAHADFVKNSDLMWRQSVWSSVLAASIASKHLKEGGLLTLTGAKPALEGNVNRPTFRFKLSNNLFYCKFEKVHLV